MSEIINIPENVPLLGFFGDVHGEYMNIARMEELTNSSAMWFCVGDAVDMDVAPHCNQPVIRLIRKLKAFCVRGNHEKVVQDKRLSEYDPATVEFLKALPDALQVRFGDLRIQVFHNIPGDEVGTTPRPHKLHPQDPNTRETYLNAFRKRSAGIYVTGHIQGPFDIIDGDIRIINPGSLGGKGNEPPSFALMNREGLVQIKRL